MHTNGQPTRSAVRPLHERSVVSNASTFDKESLGRPALDRKLSQCSPIDLIVGNLEYHKKIYMMRMSGCHH